MFLQKRLIGCHSYHQSYAKWQCKQCVHRKYFTYEWTVFKFRTTFDHIPLDCHYIQTHILCGCVYIAQIIFAMVAVATNESLINSPVLWCLFINIAATTLTYNAEQTSLHKRSHCIKKYCMMSIWLEHLLSFTPLCSVK